MLFYISCNLDVVYCGCLGCVVLPVLSRVFAKLGENDVQWSSQLLLMETVREGVEPTLYSYRLQFR